MILIVRETIVFVVGSISIYCVVSNAFVSYDTAIIVVRGKAMQTFTIDVSSTLLVFP